VTAPRTQQLCTFRLADLYFGVPANTVQEMIRTSSHTRVPLVSPVIHGLVNLRGEIVTTIDLRHRLGFPPLDHGRDHGRDNGQHDGQVDGEHIAEHGNDHHDDADQPVATNVVIRTGDTAISLVVDAIGDVITVDNASFEAVPTKLNEQCRAVVDGVYQLDGELLLTIDLDRLLDVDAVVGALVAVP
jgi:chemotaxis signal transduction protein